MNIDVTEFGSSISKKITVAQGPSPEVLEDFYNKQLMECYGLHPWEVDKKLYEASKDPRFSSTKLDPIFAYYWEKLSQRIKDTNR
ncbi:MAG: hypothetical protein ACRCZS_16920 [Chroococcidiopsis sp.]